MEIDEGGRSSADGVESLFGLPTSPSSHMERSREALFLRLEQMKIVNSQQMEQSNVDPIEERATSVGSPTAKARSKAIPIKKANRGYNHNHQEGRGFTDDMMFFAEGDNQNSHDSNEPFVPPHLQHSDSFSVHSFA